MESEGILVCVVIIRLDSRATRAMSGPLHSSMGPPLAERLHSSLVRAMDGGLAPGVGSTMSRRLGSGRGGVMFWPDPFAWISD